VLSALLMSVRKDVKVHVAIRQKEGVQSSGHQGQMRSTWPDQGQMRFVLLLVSLLLAPAHADSFELPNFELSRVSIANESNALVYRYDGQKISPWHHVPFSGVRHIPLLY
jgi:hypothetical protein